MDPDYKARKRGEPIVPIEERLYSHIKINEISGCWEWQGSTRAGYGRLTIGSRKDGTRRIVMAHRLSYELNYGEIPENMEICHKCDNRCCINPEHLFVGTHQDNMDDRERKGRNVVPYGENNGMHKLTSEDVEKARLERMHLMTTYQALADKYGVSKKTIMNAIKGKTWKTVPPPMQIETLEDINI